ncbi:MAG TPA: hypothetical protein VNY73_05620, partial [Bacteroidia bacterium]|nr:hypothetical protein [Bacteroidia bacterium]
WIGAHLIKDAWGGLDNMMNVVAWPDAAEKTWSEGFEDPIDDAFLHGTTDAAHMTIKVAKEDEAIPRAEANAELVQKIPGGTVADKTKLLEAETEKARWEINKAIETVPELAFGVSTINRHPVSLDQGATGFHAANVLSRRYLSDLIADKVSKIGAARAEALANAKTQDEIDTKETDGRSKERKAAIIAERKNLQPDIFHQNLENIDDREYR